MLTTHFRHSTIQQILQKEEKKTISRNFSLENYPAILEMARMYLPHLICKRLVLGLPGVP